MRRRELLASVGGIAIAGCSGSSPSGQADPAGESTPSEEPTKQSDSSNGDSASTESAPPASFELFSVDAPERAEIGEEVSYSFTVRNTGGRPGTFETKIDTRIGATGSWSGGGETWREEIRPGVDVTLESQTFTWDYMERLDFRITAFDREFSIQFVSKTLAFGKSYTNPDQVTIGVNEVRFADSYEWSSSGYNYVEEPTSGNKWAFAKVWASNGAGQPEWAPHKSNFSIVIGSSQYDYELSRQDSEVYEGGEVQPGIMRDGEILFQVPSRTAKGDLEVVYSEQFFDGSVAAYWSTDGE